MKVAKKTKKQPRPVSGHVIGVSVLAIIGMTVVMAILFLVGLGLAATWLTTEGKSIWMLIAGLLLMLICPLAVVLGVYRLKVKERLIVGTDRFQIIHRIQGEDEVITQIPYANMSKLEFAQGTQSNYLGIEIAELDEPATYQKQDNFEAIKGVRGFHCVIDGGYTEALETIYEMLVERFRHFHPGE
jgi:hypothetical protein